MFSLHTRPTVFSFLFQQSTSAATLMTLRKELWEEFPFLTTKKWLYFVARTTVQKGMTVANNKKNHPLGKLTFFLLSFDSYWEIFKKNPPLQKSWRGDKKNLQEIKRYFPIVTELKKQKINKWKREKSSRGKMHSRPSKMTSRPICGCTQAPNRITFLYHI